MACRAVPPRGEQRDEWVSCRARGLPSPARRSGGGRLEECRLSASQL